MHDEYSQGSEPKPADHAPSYWERVWWASQTLSPGVALILVIVILVAAASLLRPLLAPADAPFAQTAPPDTASFFSVASLDQERLYYSAPPPNLGLSDIFSHSTTLTDTTASNLTNSPDFAEYYPQPSRTGNQVAFLALSSGGDRSVRIRQMNGQVVDLSYSAMVDSRGNACSVSLTSPPQWDEGGRWVAALANCGESESESVHLFVFGVEQDIVIDVSPGARKVTNFVWLDNEMLLYSDVQSQKQIALMRTSTNLPQPIQLTTIYNR